MVASSLLASQPHPLPTPPSLPTAAAAPPSPPRPGLYSPSTFGLIAALFLISFITDALSKDILRYHPIPLTLSLSQFAVSTLTSALYLYLSSPSPLTLPHPSSSTLTSFVLPISLCHCLGFLLTNLSLATLPVSFTHTIKASESLFTALLSSLILHQPLGVRLISALLPIAAGVAVSSWNEAEWTWLGLISALTSNLLFASRSTLTARGKRRQREEGRKVGGEAPLDDIQLYLFLSLFATLMLLPVWMATEQRALPPLVAPFLSSLSSLSPSSLASHPPTPSFLWHLTRSSLLLSLLVNGALHYAYNQCSLFLLSRLSPITHVVVNACRRLFVIYLSVVWYGVSLTRGNVIGTFMVIGGVLWFGYEKTRLDAATRQMIKKHKEQ